jgi:hypothetical protein
MTEPPDIALHDRPGRPRKHAGLSPRERLDLAKAIEKERQNRLADSILMPRDTHLRIVMDHGRRARTDLLNAGNELGPMLVGLNARQIKTELDLWTNRTLTRWADWADQQQQEGATHE